MKRSERTRPEGLSGWGTITLLSLVLHATLIVSIPPAPPPKQTTIIHFELAPLPSPSPEASPSVAPSIAPSVAPSVAPSAAPSAAPRPQPSTSAAPSPEARPSPAARPSPSEKAPPPPKPTPPPPPPIINKKVRLGPTLDTPVPSPTGSAPPPPVAPESTPMSKKSGLPDPKKNDGGAPDQPKLKAPVHLAPARPVTARARPRPTPKRMVNKKGAGPDRRQKPDPTLKTAKGKPRRAPQQAFKVLEDIVQEGAPTEIKPRETKLPDLAEKDDEKDELEGEEEGTAIDLARATPPAPGARGEVAPGRDPAADEEGFIPLTEALRRSGGGGAVPDIVPDWISSNMSQDGDIGLEEYKRALLAQIAQAKVYPAGWDPARFNGFAVIAGTVDGYTGRLISVWLVESSGRREIDRAAVQTIARASPFPPIGTMGVLRFQMAIRYGPAEQQASR